MYEPKKGPTPKIDDGIPMPVVVSRQRRVKYPFADLAVGQSFLVDNQNERRVSSAASRAKSILGREFFWDYEGDGIRVWRKS